MGVQVAGSDTFHVWCRAQEQLKKEWLKKKEILVICVEIYKKLSKMEKKCF